MSDNCSRASYRYMIYDTNLKVIMDEIKKL